MKERAKLGMNRTGMQSAGSMADRMLEVVGSDERVPEGGLMDSMISRSEAIQEKTKVGSVPVPGTFKGLTQAVLQRLKGERAEVFIDKLGERIAFERTGVRLYELLIGKCAALEEAGTSLGPISIETLRDFRNEEGWHFQILREVIESLGADPTAQTPGADTSAVAGRGLLEVIADPRTTLVDSLQAILIAEQADNGEWELLIRMAREIGSDELVSRFESALKDEERHLRTIHQWYGDLVLKQLQVA